MSIKDQMVESISSTLYRLDHNQQWPPRTKSLIRYYEKISREIASDLMNVLPLPNAVDDISDLKSYFNAARRATEGS